MSFICVHIVMMEGEDRVSRPINRLFNCTSHLIIVCH